MRETLHRAFHTSDMTVDEFDLHGTAIASLGAAQIRNRHASLGSLLARCWSGHWSSLPRAMWLFRERVVRLAERKRWPGVQNRALALTMLALHRYFNPKCHKCRGVGTIRTETGEGRQEGYDGSVIAICKICKGVGDSKPSARREADLLRMDMDEYRRAGMDERLKDLVSQLQAAEGYCMAATRKQADNGG